MNLLGEALILLTIATPTGLMLKLADSLGERKNSLKGFVVAGGAAVGFWLLLKSSPTGSTLSLAIILGSLAALKVDRLNLWFGLAVTGLLALILGYVPPLIPALIPLAALTAADEYLHGYGGKLTGVLGKLAVSRLLLKVGVIVLALTGLLSLAAIPAILAFDLAYEAMGRLMRSGWWRPAVTPKSFRPEP